MAQALHSVNGDYYCIGRQGEYKKHAHVRVHCRLSNNDSQQRIIPTKTEPTNPQKSARERTPPMMICCSSRECKKVLEKEEVNSIHEQETSIKGHEIKNTSSFCETREHKSYMRRSIQNQVHPKRGILKRSLIDKNENHLFNSNNSCEIPTKQIKIKEIYRNLQRCYSPTSNQPQNIQNSAQLVVENKMQHFSSVQAQTHKNQNSYSARPNKQVKQRPLRANSHRQHAQDKNTIAIHQTKKQVHQACCYNIEINQDISCFQTQICQQIDFIKCKVKQIEIELKSSEFRMKEFALQRELKIKQAQIQSKRKQNEAIIIQNGKCQIQCDNQDNSRKSNTIPSSSFDILHLVKSAQKNSAFVVAVLMVILVIICLGKSSPICKH